MPVPNNTFACIDMKPCPAMTSATAQTSSMPYEVELSTVAYTAGAQIKGMRIFKTRTTIYINAVRVKKVHLLYSVHFVKSICIENMLPPPPKSEKLL